MTVRQLLASIDSRELTEWMAYERLEPFGPKRDDERAGLLATIATSVAGMPYVAPGDWLDTETQPDAEQAPPTAEDLERMAQAWTRNVGGEFVLPEASP